MTMKMKESPMPVVVVLAIVLVMALGSAIWNRFVKSATVTETLPQICRSVRSNQVQAKSTYIGKRLTTTGEVLSVKEHVIWYTPRYSKTSYVVALSVDQITVHASTYSKESIKELSVGKTISVSGEITTAFYRANGCVISIENAIFSNP